MRATGRQRERPARRDPEESPLGIERVEERKEVALVCSSAVQEHERSLGRPCRGALEEAKRLDGHATQAARGSGSGVSTGSI